MQILKLNKNNRPVEKMASDSPNRIRRIFSLLIQTLPTFWTEWILILIVFILLILWTPTFWISRSPDLQISGFPDPQISKFPDFQISRKRSCSTPKPGPGNPEIWNQQINKHTNSPCRAAPRFSWPGRARVSVMLEKSFLLVMAEA